MDLQQGLKVKRKAGEGGLIMGALVELEKAEAAALGSASRNTPVSPSAAGHRPAPVSQPRLTGRLCQPKMTVVSDTTQLASEASSQDPAVGLRAVRALRVLIERLEALQVDNARDQNWPWQEIAVCLGVTRQAVHKKYAGGRGLLRGDK